MIRFVHTADWQLGMSRRFLGPEAQARFDAARLEAIAGIARLVRSEDCAFVVVCGDVFDSNQVDRQVVARALDALRAVPVPVFLLPGNHDALDAGSVYLAPPFLRALPDNVRVLSDFRPVVAAATVSLHPAPWLTRRPDHDPLSGALAGIAAAAASARSRSQRVLVGHGSIDTLSPRPEDPANIRLAAVESLVAEGAIDYVALGDRHSATDLGRTGRIWYSGSPEATDFGEEASGEVLVVGLAEQPGGAPSVQRHRVGRWRFLEECAAVSSGDDVRALCARLSAVEHKGETILKLGLEGTLSLREKAELDEELERFAAVFACLQPWERQTDLVVRPEDDDFADLALSGFAAGALDELRALATEPGENGAAARDALGLLVRLARGA